LFLLRGICPVYRFS